MNSNTESHPFKLIKNYELRTYKISDGENIVKVTQRESGCSPKTFYKYIWRCSCNKYKKACLTMPETSYVMPTCSHIEYVRELSPSEKEENYRFNMIRYENSECRLYLRLSKTIDTK